MNLEIIKKYSLNCFLLTLPIMFWNMFLTNKLPKDFQPEIFWNDIPILLIYGENITRFAVFILTFLMPISISTLTQKRGFILYLVGMIVYFTSWLILIEFPDSSWSKSLIGFTAPAWTPSFWLIGVGLIGNSFYFGLPFKRCFFILTSTIFLMFHNFHAIIIYFRTH